MLFWIAVFITIIYYFVLIRLDKKRQAAYWTKQNAIGKAPIDFPTSTETSLVDGIIFTSPSSQKKKSISAQHKQGHQEILAEEIQEKTEERRKNPIELNRKTKHKLVPDLQKAVEIFHLGTPILSTLTKTVKIINRQNYGFHKKLISS